MQLSNSAVEIGTTPITWADYARFAREIGHSVPMRQETPVSPVTGVSTADARAFAEWLSQRERQSHRLPTLNEMCIMADQTRNELSLWPCCAGDMHKAWRRAHDCLSEWLNCCPTVANGCNNMNCIAHPAWLLNNHRTVTHAALTDSGHSFVTFHLVPIER